MKINIDDEIEINDEEENIYQKLARATARVIDIELGKTTLADLLDGYTKSRVLQERIDKAIEYIKNYLPNYDFDHSNLDELLEILGDKENE